MLHQELMFRFHETDRVLPTVPEIESQTPEPPARRQLPVLRLAASILGNMLLGAVLLGGLLLAPKLLENALGLLGLGAAHL